MSERAVDPVRLTLSDGSQWELRPTWGALRRASKKVEGGSVLMRIADMPEQAIVPLLYESLPREGRERYTQEEFEDLLPVGPETSEAIRRLGELINDSDRPRKARPARGSPTG